MVAIKLLPRPLSAKDAESVRLETRIQAIMGKGCLNVVAAKEAVLTRSHVGIVMDYASGGDMANYMTDR